MQIFIHCKTTLHVSGVTYTYCLFIRVNPCILQYDLYQRLRVQFLILLMMGAVTPETCRLVLQWINICILLHLLDFYSHFPKFVSFMLEVEKYVRAVQATNDSMIRRMRFACCITKATDRLSRMCNNSCFSTTKMVKRTRLNITFIVHCPAVLHSPPSFNTRAGCTG